MANSAAPPRSSTVVVGYDTTQSSQAASGPFRRVAAAVDGFPEGHDAAELAALIARAATSAIQLVAIHPDPVVIMPAGSGWSDLRRDAQELLRATRDELAPEASITVRTGWSVPHSLQCVVRDGHIDLLVLGSSRGADPGRVEIGTWTRQLLGECGCALAIAPAGYSASAPTVIGRIGVGYDGGAESAAAVAIAGALASSCDTELVVAAVLDDRLPSLAWSLGGSGHTPAIWDTLLATDLDALEARAHYAVETFCPAAEVRAELGSPPAVLQQLSDEVDLLVIGSRRWGAAARVLLGSLGESLVHGACCPVLITPRPGH